MQKLNKLVYIHYNLKLRSRNRKRRQFEDQRDYFCPISLDYIFSKEDTVFGEWLEEQEESVLDQDPEFEELMEELTGDRPEPLRAAEWIEEINLTMQQGRAPDTSKPRGKEVDEESESSISTSSSSAGIPPDSPRDEGHYRDDEPVSYETVEHFSGATELDPRRGYVRHVGQTEVGDSNGAAGQGVGEGTHSHHGSYVGQGAMYRHHGGYVGQQGAMYGQHGAYVGQQGAMNGQHESYSYNPNWVPPSPTPILSIEQMLIEQGRLAPPVSQRSFHAPHAYFMPFDYLSITNHLSPQGIKIVHHLIKNNLNMVMGMVVLRNSMEHIFLTNTEEMMMMMMITSQGDTSLGIRLSICHILILINFSLVSTLY